MSKIEVVLDSAGIQALMKSAEIADICEAEAKKRTQATGVEYVPDVYYGKSRVNAGGYDAEKGD